MTSLYDMMSRATRYRKTQRQIQSWEMVIGESVRSLCRLPRGRLPYVSARLRSLEAEQSSRKSSFPVTATLPYPVEQFTSIRADICQAGLTVMLDSRTGCKVYSQARLRGPPGRPSGSKFSTSYAHSYQHSLFIDSLVRILSRSSPQ